VKAVSGRASDYNFATVQLHDDWAKLENPYPHELEQRVSFSEQEQEVLAKT
jgi:hypothetical protein